MFVTHTLDSAPAGSRRLMETTVAHFGHLGDGVARLAESPEMLGGFLKMSGLFETVTLDPLAREVVIMAVATRNGCEFCTGMHSERLRTLDGGEVVAKAFAAGDALTDPRLEALRVFTQRIFTNTGAVPDDEMSEFLAAGYTTRNALEVVLGIGTYTMSTFANRLVKA